MHEFWPERFRLRHLIGPPCHNSVELPRHRVYIPSCPGKCV